jgi:hypothetical protein
MWTRVTVASIGDAMDRSKCWSGDGEKDTGMTINGFDDTLAAVEAGGNEDESICLVEIRTGGTERSSTVLAGDEKALAHHFAGSKVHHLTAKSNRSRAAIGLSNLIEDEVSFVLIHRERSWRP